MVTSLQSLLVEGARYCLFEILAACFCVDLGCLQAYGAFELEKETFPFRTDCAPRQGLVRQPGLKHMEFRVLRFLGFFFFLLRATSEAF